jgi:thiol-disulfide isomerase/thioredoxin
MRLTSLLWQLATASIAAAVVELSPDTFDAEVLKSGRPSLIKFYAPWCGRKWMGALADAVAD